MDAKATQLLLEVHADTGTGDCAKKSLLHSSLLGSQPIGVKYLLKGGISVERLKMTGMLLKHTVCYDNVVY